MISDVCMRTAVHIFCVVCVSCAHACTCVYMHSYVCACTINYPSIII